MNKATAIAPSNIAFIKYWGKKDEGLRLPENGSISMNLSNLTTTTTVEFSSTYEHDSVIIDGIQKAEEAERVCQHLDRIRTLSRTNGKARVVSHNSFPSSRGLSSSASGFAALTVAAVRAIGLSLSEKDLSILARQGSGSACRSIPSGFVEWLDGDTSETSYAQSLYEPSYWNILDIVVVTGTDKKEISTREGMTRSSSSAFIKTRLDALPNKIILAKKLLQTKNFLALGQLIEDEALEMHAVMITSHPPLLYWTQATLHLMKQVIKWRSEGIQAFFSINTGQDIHVLCEEKTKEELLMRLSKESGIIDIIVNYPSLGTRLTETHLF